MSWHEDLLAIVEGVCPDDLPDLIGELARAQAVAQLQLRPPQTNGQMRARPSKNGGKLIDATAAAKILGTNPRWLYDRADSLPFTRRLGPRTLRFDEAGIRRWLETRR